MPVPFEVVPSGKIKKGEYCAVCSISSCLSWIAYSAFCNYSSDPPLGIYIESKKSINVPKSGIPLNSALGAKAGLKCLIKTTTSSQLIWLHTIVDVLFIGL